jgi:hypothetical protein
MEYFIMFKTTESKQFQATGDYVGHTVVQSNRAARRAGVVASVIGFTAVAVASANAAIDVTAITGLITDGVTAVAAIGVGFGLFWGTRKIYSKLFGA